MSEEYKPGDLVLVVGTGFNYKGVISHACERMYNSNYPADRWWWVDIGGRLCLYEANRNLLRRAAPTETSSPGGEG